jgi:hypothetical protein
MQILVRSYSKVVRSLYTNIPHDLGIFAITVWLENKRNIVQDRFSKEFILETVKIILLIYELKRLKTAFLFCFCLW